MLSDVFHYIMADDPDISALVLDSAGNVKISPMDTDQSAQNPRITWQVISDVPVTDFDDVGPFTFIRIQVDCYADKYQEVETLAHTVWKKLRKVNTQKRGEWIAIRFIEGHDVSTSPTDGTAHGVRRKTMDFRVAYITPTWQ